MTPQMIILLFWVVLIIVIWRVFRSKFFRGACDDINAMHDAPENKGRTHKFEAYMADPLYQMNEERRKEKATGKKSDHENP